LPQPSVPDPLGTPFIELQSVDSTNNYARSLLNEGLAQHGTTVFAHEQLSGKGQRGKIWITEKDANLILSVVIKPAPLQSLQQFRLSACTAVGIHEFFRKYAGNDIKIKWPNDLYWQDRKAGGILIENVIEAGYEQSMTGDRWLAIENEQQISQWKWSIIGIGININQTSFPEELKNPVSLKQITGRNFDPVILARELCAILTNYFQQLITEGFDSIYAQYVSHLYKKNEKIKLKKSNRVFETLVKGVSTSGKLITQHTIEEEFDFGEVEWVI
jgi:BirA family transcriptional regulator, biotin operon repressor / biotin---[acetyl-CoA-carboxylase] ligase